MNYVLFAFWPSSAVPSHRKRTGWRRTDELCSFWLNLSGRITGIVVLDPSCSANKSCSGFNFKFWNLDPEQRLLAKVVLEQLGSRTTWPFSLCKTNWVLTKPKSRWTSHWVKIKVWDRLHIQHLRIQLPSCSIERRCSDQTWWWGALQTCWIRRPHFHLLNERQSKKMKS